MLMIQKTKAASLKVPARNFIASMDLFKGLPPEVLSEIERRVIEKKYAKGSSIFLEGDAAKFVWFVKEGHVKAVIHSPNGHCQSLCMVGAQKMFGACCSFGGGTYPCNSVAETDVTVVSFPLSDFLALMGRFPQISQAVIQQLSKRLRDSKETQTFEQESVEKRILHILLNMAAEFGNTIPLTRREIAEMAGTTVETSIRTFSKLSGLGLVSTVRGRITLGDARLLQERMNSFEEKGEKS